MNFDFESYERAVSAAADQAQRAKEQLVTHEGHPRFPAEQQAMLLGNALAPLQAEVESAYSLAERAMSEADVLDSASYNDPMANVDDATLSRMGLLANFVKEEIAESSQIALANRLRAVVAHGDDATKRLYLRYVKPEPGRDGSAQVTKLLTQLDEKVNGKQRQALAKDLERAQSLRAGAIGLKMSASNHLGRIDGSFDRQQRERLNRVGGQL